MLKRNTWIAVLAFLVLAGLVYLVQKNEDSIPFLKPTASPTAALIIHASTSEIVSLSIQDSLGHFVQAKRGVSKDWQISSPAGSLLSVGSIELVLAEIAGMHAQGSLTEKVDPQVLGFEDPEFKLVIGLGNGLEYRVVIGALTPIQNGSYIQVNENQVFVVSTSSVQAIRDLFAEAYPSAEPEVTSAP